MSNQDKHYFIIHYKNGDLKIMSSIPNINDSTEYFKNLYECVSDENIKEYHIITGTEKSKDNKHMFKSICERYLGIN